MSQLRFRPGRPLALAAPVLAATLGVASAARAADLQCNKEQTRCLTETKDLTIGDQVGVFTTDGQLVATGEVKSMHGERRAVLIQKKHGAIRKGYTLALLGDRKSDVSTEAYKIYHEPAKVSFGASLGYSTFNIGEGIAAPELSGYGAYRFGPGFTAIGRAVYVSLNGDVTHDDGARGDEQLPLTATGIGLLGGVAYTARESKTIGFRGELAAGGLYVAAAVDGDSGLADDPSAHAKLKNGLNPYGRAAVGAMLNFAPWHVHADAAQSLAHEAMAYTLAIGASRDLD
jgi:hypothetical protein